MSLNAAISNEQLHDLLLEAAETERRLPAALPRTNGSFWPVMQPDWMAYADEDEAPRISPANTRQVTEYDFTIQVVLNQPDADYRKLMWACAHSAVFRQRGIAWRKLARIRRCDPRKVKRDYEKALLDTAMKWNSGLSHAKQV